MRLIIRLAFVLVAGVVARAQVPFPAISQIGEEEFISGDYIERPSVAADSLGQPHMVCDAGGKTPFLKFHRINGAWRGGVFAVGSRGGRYDASRLYIGQIEIDSRDRAWISCKFGVKEYGSMYGQGIWLFRNITAAPAEQFFRFVCVYKGMGVVTTDAKYPDQGVVIGTFGNYAILYSTGQTLGTGTLNAGPGGEKVRARIASYAPRFEAEAGRTYDDGIWHTAMNGYSASSSKYQNSERKNAGLGPVDWAAYSVYPEQGSDFSHPGIGIDLVNPRLCYIGSVFNGRLCLNIWDGGRTLFPSTALKVLDFGATYEVRHGPAFAPAPEGGTFIFWTAGGRIRCAYVSPAGETSETIDITAGRSPAAATDRFGNIHLVYSANGPRYRKITLSALNPLAPKGRLTDTRTPEFQWSATLASAYTLALSRDGELAQTVTVETNIWTPSAPLVPGSYSWIVREGGILDENPWSRPLTFVVPPAVPVPEAPVCRIEEEEGRAAGFSWSCADPCVNKYKLELFRGAELVSARTVSTAGITWPVPLEPGAYAWRVKAIRSIPSFPVTSEWSPLQSFQVEVPGPCTITSPAPMQAFAPGPLTFTAGWTEAEGAEGYTLTLLHNNSLLTAVTNVPGTAHEFVLKGQPGYLTLVVQPENGAGGGAASPTRTFLVERIMAPCDGGLLDAARSFAWTRSKNATRYLFKLSRYNAETKKYAVVQQAWAPQTKGSPVRWSCPYAFTPGAYRWAITDYRGETPGFTSSTTFLVP